MEAQRSIEVFLGRDPERARRAFDQLAPRLCRFLNEYLKSLLPLEAEREDAISESLTRLWKYRTSFQYRSEGAWWAFAAKVARNCAYSQLGMPQNRELPTEFSEIESASLDLAASIAEDRERLYRIADAVWLLLPGDMSETERRRRLLAAQLFFLEKMPWEEVCALVGGSHPIERQTLDTWLSDKAVILDLAYHRLFWTNDRLTGYLLRNSEPLNANELDALAVGADSLGLDWGADAANVIVLRYRYGLITEKIAQLQPALDRAAIEGWIESAGQALPFADLAADLLCALHSSKHSPAIFHDAGLWKRIVFQYYAAHELPHRQILERTEPASTAAGYRLTLGMLNVWLSNGRIFCELAKYVKREVVHG
jgi:DNA-directed RNA polymerase specialized sigma24 family protein